MINHRSLRVFIQKTTYILQPISIMVGTTKGINKQIKLRHVLNLNNIIPKKNSRK